MPAWPAGRLAGVAVCGRSSSVEHQLPKLDRRVQFPSPAWLGGSLPAGRQGFRSPALKMQKSKLKNVFKNYGFYIVILHFAFCILNLTGCATVKYAPQTGVPKTQGLGLSGIHHRVVKGQTLWRISKIYGVELDEIIRINNIKDSAQIEAGQSVFIPGNLRAQQSPAVTQPFGLQDFVWPKKGKIISGFGEKTNNGINKGITIGPGAGSNVVASASGTVVFSNENLGDYGKTLIISHNDGIMTLYSLLSHILVKPGDYINRGTPIAKCENGLLHFEIRRGHIPQNPYYYLSR